MKIVDYEMVPTRIPLAREYVIARGVTREFRNVIVQLWDDHGHMGLGECALYSVVGDQPAALDTMRRFCEVFVGLEVGDVRRLLTRTLARPHVDLAPFAAIDIALWDLEASAAAVPLYRMLGGDERHELFVDFTLSQGSAGQVAVQAADMQAKGGYRAFCVKVGGNGDVQSDIDRIAAVRSAVGGESSIRVDANEGFDLDAATRLMRAIERFDIEFIEQPLPRGDYDGLAELKARTGCRISLDEGCVTVGDLYRIAGSGVADVVNVKLPKCGGITAARRMVDLATAAGLDWICGGALSLEIVRQASRHFTIALGSGTRSHEGPGPASQALLGDVVTPVVGYDSVRLRDGCVSVDDVPGLGVVIDRESLIRFGIECSG